MAGDPPRRKVAACNAGEGILFPCLQAFLFLNNPVLTSLF